jgi:hypothetical protein
MGRSKNHPTSYKVGEWRGAGVFWSPSNPGDYALEIDGDCLYPLVPEAIDEVEFFKDDEDYCKMIDALQVNQGLRSSLPQILLVAMCEYSNREERDADKQISCL